MNKTLSLLIIMAFLSFNSAYAWSLLGPNNFDDCILQGMKGVTSDTAAKLIYQSCYDKFPEKKDTDISNIETKLRSGSPRIDIWGREPSSNLVGKVSWRWGDKNSIVATNRNEFDITGVFIGTLKDPKKNSCSPEEDAYNEIYLCFGVVNPNLTGTLKCPPLPRGPVCTVGIRGPSFLSDLDKWFKDQGF